jgi:tetraacyldisaccharide-1-P 4'-kinase
MGVDAARVRFLDEEAEAAERQAAAAEEAELKAEAALLDPPLEATQLTVAEPSWEGEPQGPAEEQPQLLLPAPPKPLMPVHLLDDGFQHRQLARTVDILLLNQDDWRDRLLPAGNLREPREAARRATVIAVPADEPELEVALHVWGWNGPVWRLQRKMEVPLVEGRAVAFCGIARPEQFFAGLEAAGVRLAFRLAFADHCVYTPALLKEVLIKADECQAAAFVTTGKDRLRLGRMASMFPESRPLLTARLTVEIEDQGSAIDWLENQIRSHPSHSPL